MVADAVLVLVISVMRTIVHDVVVRMYPSMRMVIRMTETAPAAVRGRRLDPDRKQRIIDACLKVVAERGVAGTSHRVVAAAAGVPLGSMTYHFAGMEDLLHQAFDQFARRSAARFAARMRATGSPRDACEAIAAYIEEDPLFAGGDLNINLELYTIAARDPAYRDITDHWMASSRAEIGRFFDPATASALDAMIEGLALHRALGTGCQDPAALRGAIRRVAFGEASGTR